MIGLALGLVLWGMASLLMGWLSGTLGLFGLTREVGTGNFFFFFGAVVVVAVVAQWLVWTITTFPCCSLFQMDSPGLSLDFFWQVVPRPGYNIAGFVLALLSTILFMFVRPSVASDEPDRPVATGMVLGGIARARACVWGGV